jgi:hypothetical protein
MFLYIDSNYASKSPKRQNAFGSKGDEMFDEDIGSNFTADLIAELVDKKDLCLGNVTEGADILKELLGRLH